MPVVLGLASSHAPSMFTPAAQWPEVHRLLVREVPQPAQLADETPDVIEGYIKRIGAGFATLEDQVRKAKLDALIIIGDDQNEVFSNACVPPFAVFAGESANGSTSVAFIGQDPEQNRVTLRGDPKLGRFIVDALMARGFDPAYMEKIDARGNPRWGLGHAFTRVAKAIHVADTDMPVIPFFVNGCHPPLPSAERCYDLGRALMEIFAGRPERIGLFGTGGLSHNPIGPRAGWVDEPLDRWLLAALENGEGAKLKNLFTFDSDAMRGGTGEIRAWVAVAGAFDGQRAKIVDYIPARHAVTGLGFAYWTAEGSRPQ